MKSGFKFVAFAGIAVLSLATLSSADTSTHSKKKAAKVVALPPLPSGPQGPVPQIPLDSIAPVPPQVSYQNGQLTIVAPNSTLGDILRAVRKQTSADIEVPPATERVVTHLGPGPAREIVAELLNGSRFNPAAGQHGSAAARPAAGRRRCSRCRRGKSRRERGPECGRGSRAAGCAS